MEIIFIVSILASAFFHAWYNFLMHKSQGSRLFLLALFCVAACCSFFVFLLSPHSISIPFPTFIIIYAASVFFVLYQICVAKAYEKGEISRMYPLTVLSPVFVPVWAVLFLNESPSIGVLVGIFITTIGAIAMKQTSFSWHAFGEIFSRKNMYQGAGFALTASLMYSIGSVFDKARIADFSLFPYLWILLTCMACNMLVFTLIFDRAIFKDIPSLPWKRVLFAGILGYLSFFTFRYALQQVDVSVAVPIRTSSIVFAVILGFLLAKEQLSKAKIIGISAIIIGILIIHVSV